MSHKDISEGEFCWNELLTTNTTAAKQFYQALLGWQAQDIEMDGFTYTLFKKGEKDIGGMMQISKDQANTVPPHWMSYIMVENLEEKVHQAQKLGATIKIPITPIKDYGLFTILVDPAGAHIALWQSLKEC